MLGKTVTPADSGKVKQAHGLFIKYLLNAKMRAEGQGMGLDVPVTLWECQVPNAQSSVVLQGTDAGAPTAEEDLKNFKTLVDLLCGGEPSK
ncbi:MAG: hypothetical protein KDE47_08960 [Caldilineaceae bacterium]|nr:hypothetical protein [Caldilineaceae bacterium]MCP5532329.1 hypothetical protein [Akkermansiaceae bacterium]